MIFVFFVVCYMLSYTNFQIFSFMDKVVHFKNVIVTWQPVTIT